MNRIQKALLRNSGLNIVEYTLVYMIKSFIIWDFTNPFRWIMDMPTYKPDTRGMILFAIVLWQTLQIIFLMPSKKRIVTN